MSTKNHNNLQLITKIVSQIKSSGGPISSELIELLKRITMQTTNNKNGESTELPEIHINIKRLIRPHLAHYELSNCSTHISAPDGLQVFNGSVLTRQGLNLVVDTLVNVIVDFDSVHAQRGGQWGEILKQAHARLDELYMSKERKKEARFSGFINIIPNSAHDYKDEPNSITHYILSEMHKCKNTGAPFVVRVRFGEWVESVAKVYNKTIDEAGDLVDQFIHNNKLKYKRLDSEFILLEFKNKTN